MSSFPLDIASLSKLLSRFSGSRRNCRSSFFRRTRLWLRLVFDGFQLHVFQMNMPLFRRAFASEPPVDSNSIPSRWNKFFTSVTRWSFGGNAAGDINHGLIRPVGLVKKRTRPFSSCGRSHQSLVIAGPAHRLRGRVLTGKSMFQTNVPQTNGRASSPPGSLVNDGLPFLRIH